MNNVNEMENGGGPPNPNGVFVYVQNARTSAKEHFGSNYPQKLIRGLAGTQIAMAATAVLTQIVAIACGFYFHEVGAGIWVGFFYAIAGAVGLYSAQKATNCTVVSFMVMSIIAALFSICLVTFSGIGLGEGHYYRRNETQGGRKAIYAIQLLAALTEGVVAVIASAICCRVTCCRTKKAAGQVFYQGQQLPVQTGQVDMSGFQGLAVRPQTEAVSEKEKMNSLPPNYDETVTGSRSGLNETDGAAMVVPADGENYQRFA